MFPLTWILLVAAVAAVPIFDDYCNGSPAPVHNRQHQGLILASNLADFGSSLESFETWEREMTEVSWKVAFFDDGYLDDGVPFRFVTTFPAHVSVPSSISGIRNIALKGLLEERQTWLDLLRNSKVLIIHQIEGNELQNAKCAGVDVIHLVDTDSVFIDVSRTSVQKPLRMVSSLRNQLGNILIIPRGNQDDLVNAIDRAAQL